MKYFVILLFTACLSLCFIDSKGQERKADVAEKLFGDLVGTWRIQTVFDGKKDITKTDSSSIQWVEFTEDGRYRSAVGKNPSDSGSYRVNENHHILYLQSDAHKDNPAEWQMDFKDNNMILTGKDPRTQRYKYVYIKTKDKKNANKPIKPQP
jgi:hypothetical protein